MIKIVLHFGPKISVGTVQLQNDIEHNTRQYNRFNECIKYELEEVLNDIAADTDKTKSLNKVLNKVLNKHGFTIEAVIDADDLNVILALDAKDDSNIKEQKDYPPYLDCPKATSIETKYRKFNYDSLTKEIENLHNKLAELQEKERIANKILAECHNSGDFYDR